MSLHEKLSMDSLRSKLSCHMKADSTNSKRRCTSKEVRKGHRTALRRHLYGKFHIGNVLYTNQQRNWLNENTNLLVFTVRDPVDRIVSAFNYHRNLKVGEQEMTVANNTESIRAMALQVYVDCFPEVQHLAMSQSHVGESQYSRRCRRLGRELLRGHPLRRNPLKHSFPHFRFNYQYYARRVWPTRTKSVAVIRTEEQRRDTARLEYLLGGDPNIFLDDTERQTHGSEGFSVRSGVDVEGAVAVCCRIHKDIQVYHDLIMSAVNLNAQEKVETLRRLFRRCNVQRTHGESEFEFKWRAWYKKRCGAKLGTP